jgi:addiction module RelB/DinJ family antitoxin
MINFYSIFIDNRIHFSYTLVRMNTTTIHIKTDVQTRNEAKKVAEDFGFALASLVNALLRQIARHKRLTLSLDEKPNQSMIESLKKSEEDVKAGRVISFESGQEALDYLTREIENEKRSAH